MNVFTSTLSRNTLRRSAYALRTPRFPTARPSPILSLARGAASQVSGRPGSQTASHAATNVKEELGNSAGDLARTIAGGNMTSDAVQPDRRTFLGVTSAVAHSVPKAYIAFGLAGGLPYLAASGATVYLARQAGLSLMGGVSSVDPGVALTILDQALHVQVTYGAVMLSFLGALHWGMEFAGLGGYQGYKRLALGAAPVLFAWPTLALEPSMALIAQWVGFTGLWYADLRATNAGWTPVWYSQYRFYLSILVGTCIIGSLAGTSYWGPAPGHGRMTAELNAIRGERKKAQIETTGVVPGLIEAQPADEMDDAYVKIIKKEVPAEGEEGKDQTKEGEKSEQK